MTESVVIKGGSRILHDAVAQDSAVLELHATIQDNAVVKENATVSRSTVKDSAIIAGVAKVKDATIGGNVYLNIEYVGKNGDITDNSHLTYVKVCGIGYTIHRTSSSAKGYSVQMMREDGVKITMAMLKNLVEENSENRVLQYLFNARKKDFSN